jgi:hypothetical protein
MNVLIRMETLSLFIIVVGSLFLVDMTRIGRISFRNAGKLAHHRLRLGLLPGFLAGCGDCRGTCLFAVADLHGLCGFTW